MIKYNDHLLGAVALCLALAMNHAFFALGVEVRASSTAGLAVKHQGVGRRTTLRVCPPVEIDFRQILDWGLDF